MRLFILFLFLLISCGKSAEHYPICEENVLKYYPQQRLINGVETSLFPEVCKINCGGKVCSATLIGYNTILTAKHCFEACVGETVIVIFENSKEVNVSNSILHSDRDIAIGILEESVYIKPREVANNSPIAGDDLLLFGFGRTNPHYLGSTSMPRYGCNTVDNVTDHTIHFSGIDKDSGIMCYGDSGGPTYVKGVLVGVHSHCIDCEIINGTRCGNGTNVDIRVDAHLDWILNNTDDPSINPKEIERSTIQD